MTDPSRLREADALLSNPRAFSPDPVRIEAGWASWLAGILAIGVVLFFIFGIGRHWHG